MERRISERHRPKKDTLVSAISKSGAMTFGSLLDISMLGMAFKYVPLERCIGDSADHSLEIKVKIRQGHFRTLADSSVVYDQPARSDEFFFVPLRRCAVRFERDLSAKELDFVLSCK